MYLNMAHRSHNVIYSYFCLEALLFVVLSNDLKGIDFLDWLLFVIKSIIVKSLNYFFTLIIFTVCSLCTSWHTYYYVNDIIN